MARPKKVQKVKEPVRIRQRKLANGNMSLYLDVYVKGVRKVESLGLYLVPETTPIDRQQNNHARQVAEKIKAERILALQNHGVRQWDKVKRSCIALVDFLKEYEQEKFGFSTSTLKGRRDLRLKIETYLKEANCPDIVLANVDVDFCRGFIDFLRYAKNGVRKDGSVISNGAAHHHQAVLNGALNKAVRDGILSANPLKSISAKEKYQPTESMREYLTLEEMKAAMAAPCPHEAAMAKANEIKSKRMLGIDEDETEADNDNTKQLPKRIFADWLDCHIEGIRRNPSYSPATYRNYRSCVNIIKEYLKHRRRPRFLMSKIDKKFIVGLLDFMKNTYRNTKSPDNPKELSLHTLHLHQSTLVRMLNAAVKEGVMDKNPFYALGRHERISKQQSEREYLTREELLALIEAPTTNETTKRAFLFCCFTGLRYSDVSVLNIIRL